MMHKFRFPLESKSPILIEKSNLYYSLDTQELSHRKPTYSQIKFPDVILEVTQIKSQSLLFTSMLRTSYTNIYSYGNFICFGF